MDTQLVSAVAELLQAEVREQVIENKEEVVNIVEALGDLIGGLSFGASIGVTLAVTSVLLEHAVEQSPLAGDFGAEEWASMYAMLLRAAMDTSEDDNG